MSKFLSTLLASAITLGGLAMPSYAQGSPAAESPCCKNADGSCAARSAETANRGSVSSTDSNTLLANTAVLPIRMAAVASAFAIGTPVAVARCEAKELGQYSGAMVSEMNANQFITPLMVASIPGQCLRTVGALGKGIAASTNNAATAWKDPFTAKSLSLEDLDSSK